MGLVIRGYHRLSPTSDVSETMACAIVPVTIHKAMNMYMKIGIASNQHQFGVLNPIESFGTVPELIPACVLAAFWPLSGRPGLLERPQMKR